MVAAQALHRDDGAGMQETDGLLDRIAGQRDVSAIDQTNPRPAGGTGDGLGVEGRVGWVSVLACAGGTHGEARHGGERAVVRHAAYDREAGAAAGAVDEGIAMATVA